MSGIDQNKIEDLKSSLAKDYAMSGDFSIEEAAKLFKINQNVLESDLYPTKKTGFYFEEQTKKGGIVYKPDYYGWAKYMRETKFYFYSDSKNYLYDRIKKHYVVVGDDAIDWHLTEDSGSFVKPEHRNYFIRTLKSSSFKDQSTLEKTENLINLKNGVLNIETMTLTSHSPKYFFRYCLPINYDKSAECPMWIEFLKGIFPEHPEMVGLSSQIFGYIISGGDQWLHRSFVLYGEGRNGKSTYLHILRSLVGRENSSSVSLSSLDKIFSIVNLDGKLANIVEETPSDKINPEIFKKATTGELLTGAKKYQDEYEFICNARFIFACNDLPKFGDNTVAMQDRLYFIPFKRYFKKEERESGIKRRLEKELSGILNWALIGLSELKKNGLLPECSANDTIMEEFNIENDSVYAWCVEHIESGDKRISSRDLYNFYRADTENSGRKVVSDMTFFKRLNRFLRDRLVSVKPVRDNKNRFYDAIQYVSHRVNI